MSTNYIKPLAYIILLVQLFIVLMLWGLLVVLGYGSFVGSFLMGSFCYLIPVFIFTQKAVKYSGAIQVNKVLSGFYQGAFLKFVATVFSFVVVFAYLKPAKPSWVFFSFVSMQFIGWFIMFILGWLEQHRQLLIKIQE